MLRYAKSLLLMAKSFQTESNFEKAISHLKMAYELEIEDSKLKSNILYHLSRAYRLIGDYENFNKYADMYFELEA
ncbi:hypothetical protein [Lihuaxuella thermophila]|nr:hypothetical protein [Lihuaxuella thermophila]